MLDATVHAKVSEIITAAQQSQHANDLHTILTRVRDKECCKQRFCKVLQFSPAEISQRALKTSSFFRDASDGWWKIAKNPCKS